MNSNNNSFLRRLSRWLCSCFLLFSLLPVASAHDGRPAYLEINETSPGRYDLFWKTPVVPGMSFPATVKLPLGIRDLKVPVVQQSPDWRIEQRSIQTDGFEGKRVEFSGLDVATMDVLVRIQFLDGRHLTAFVPASQPWLEITAQPSKASVWKTYVMHGIRHIAFGPDHLLFILGLLLIVKDRWMLIKTVTAFTIAHSITLVIATLGCATLPIPLLNTAIAASILYLGFEVARSWRGETSFTLRHPWVAAFVFGLVHGFGFASAMKGIGLSSSELPLALFSFNIGVEIGQLGFVLLLLLLEHSLRRLEITWPRWSYAVPGYVVGSVGAFWTIQKTAILFGLSP